MTTKKRANVGFRSKSEMYENYCALPPAHRRLVLAIIDAFSKIPTK